MINEGSENERISVASSVKSRRSNSGRSGLSGRSKSSRKGSLSKVSANSEGSVGSKKKDELRHQVINKMSPRRKGFDNEYLERIKKKVLETMSKDKRVALLEPEVHFIGQIDSCKRFSNYNGLTVKYTIVTDFGQDSDGDLDITRVEGETSGQTQVVYGSKSDSISFCHPIDIHYTIKSFKSWPQIVIEVFRVDPNNKYELVGYGSKFLPFPNTNTNGNLSIGIWRPIGSLWEEWRGKIFGNRVELTEEAKNMLLHKEESLNEKRFKLVTKSVGEIALDLNCITRNFSQRLD